MDDCTLMRRTLIANAKRVAAKLLAASDNEETTATEADIDIDLYTLRRLAARYDTHCNTNTTQEVDDIVAGLAQATLQPREASKRLEQLAERLTQYTPEHTET